MRNKQLNVLVSVIEIILGLILFSIEIRDLIYLPSVHSNYLYNLDLVKYKENTYSLILLYALMFFAGISFYYNKKLYVCLTISLILSLAFKYILDFFFTISGNNPIAIYILPVLVIVLCLYFIIEVYRKKTFINIVISNKEIIFSILTSIVWLLFYTLVVYFGMF